MRLDIYLCTILGMESRAKAAHLIELGGVSVDGKIATKSSMDVTNKEVVILSGLEFASMGGYKLDKALQDFDFSANGLVACDIGASNGGFTDCLLGHGANKVFAVDVGDCALSDALRNDSRVVIKDRLNARDMVVEHLGERVDLVVIDVSFISLKLILPQALGILKPNGSVIALIKPQFEVGKKLLSKKGIVTDIRARERILKDIRLFGEGLGMKCIGTTTAPIREGKNIEYLIYLKAAK